MFYKVVQLPSRELDHSVYRLDFTLQDIGNQRPQQWLRYAGTSLCGVKLKFYKKPSNRERVEENLIEKKVLVYLTEFAKIKDVKTSIYKWTGEIVPPAQNFCTNPTDALKELGDDETKVVKRTSCVISG